MPHPTTSALLAIIQHAAQPMGVSDPHAPDHPMVGVNAAFEALTGYAAAETIGRNCRFLQGPGTDPATPARIRACIAAERGCVEWIVNHRKDGSRFWNLLFMMPVRSPEGALLHYFANQRDMSAEVPLDLPDYVLGPAELAPAEEAAFQALLAETLAAPGDSAAAALQDGIAAATRLNEITTALRRTGGLS